MSLTSVVISSRPQARRVRPRLPTRVNYSRTIKAWTPQDDCLEVFSEIFADPPGNDGL